MDDLQPDEALRNLNLKAKERAKWRAVYQARYTMNIISVLCFLSAVVLFFNESINTPDVTLYILAIGGGLYVGLSIWAKSNPKLAIITAIIVFLFPIITNIFAFGYGSIFEGLWWKVLILTMFIRGLLSIKNLSLTESDDELLDDF